MVFEEGLDISSLPDNLREDFEKLDRLEGQFRVTNILMEAVDLEELSPRKDPLCGFCDVKKQAEDMNEMVEQFKTMKTLSKVTLSEIVAVVFFYRSLLKVERGSEMYKEGIRWTEFLEPLSTHKAHLVPDNILHNHPWIG